MCLCLLACAGGPVSAQTAPFQTSIDATWQTALRLAQSGQDAQALPLMERLVSAAPRNKQFRFELALILYRLGRDGRARYHLGQVRGAALTDAEARLVNQVLAKIQERKVWSGHFSFNIRPETNGTKQTEDRILVIGGFPLTLNDTAIGKPTVSTIVSTGFGYAPTLRPGLKAEFSLHSYLKYNTEVALRDYQLTGRAGLAFSPDATRHWAGGLSLNTRRAADVPYSETAGLYLSHARQVSRRGTLRFGAEISRTFRRAGRTDIDRGYASVSYSHAVGGHAQISTTGFIERNLTDERGLDGLRRGISIGGLYAFNGGLITKLSLRLEDDERTGVNPVFGVARKDKKTVLDLRIYHRDFRVGQFAPQIQLGIERNRSNIPLADYTNRYFSLGLTRKF